MTTGLSNTWKKSSRSAGNGGQCIEVRTNHGVQIRDSKDITGPVLSINGTAWTAFVGALSTKSFGVSAAL